MSPARGTARGPLACFASVGIYAGAWGALMPDIKRQVGATDAELGLALISAVVGTVAAMVVAGSLWRRFGWWLLPASAILFGFALLGPIVATAPIALGAALLLTGATSGALDVSMNTAISDVEVSSGSRLMYGAHALFSLGALGGSIATGVARQAGVQVVFILAAVATVLVLVGLVAIGSVRQAPHGVVPGQARTATRDQRPLVAGIAGLAVLCAVSFLIEDAVQNWSALHLERDLASGPGLGGAAPGIFAGAMFLGRSLGQRAGSRWSERALLSGGAAIAAIGLAVVTAAPSAPLALAGLGVAGGGIALVAPALYARAGRVADPRDRAAAIARLTVFGYSGFLLGPALIGGLAEVAGLRLAIGFLALLAVLLALGGLAVLGRSDRDDVVG